MAVGALVVLNQYLDPAEGTWLRWLWACAGSLLFFVNAPSLLGRRQRPEAAPPEPGPAPAPPPVPLPRRGLRSTVRQRWPRLARFLPGFRLRRPADLPPAQPTPFRGRTAELDQLASELERLHQRAKASRLRRPGDHPPADGSVVPTPVVRIHGMPGVGKTALAQRLGHRVARRYRDGQLYANLGSGGAARQPADVLKEFLLALGWPEREMPPDAATRAKVFRTITHDQRILVLLDAARDANQIRDLIPSGRRCAVVVTSRRDLGTEFGGSALSLGVPDEATAKEILRAVTTAELDDEPVHAAAIVWRCGRLPRALRAAAARTTRPSPAGGETSLRELSQTLWREPPLDYLTVGGFNLRDDFKAEYDRLLAQEQLAFRLLTLVASPTFVSWVLRPLLSDGVGDIGPLAAETLLSRLVAAHLVEVVGQPDGSGPKRYRFHELVRQLAVELRDDPATAGPDGARDVARALRRLDSAYVAVARTALVRAGEPVTPGTDVPWLPDDYVLEHISRHRERWVRAEQASLVRALASGAAGGDVELSWRIGRWLGRHVPWGTPAALVDAAFAAAVRADTPVEGRLWVDIARIGHLAAIDRHDEAIAEADRVIQVAGGQGLTRIAAVAHRRRTEVLLEIGAYRSAHHAAGSAAQAFEAVGPPSRNGRDSAFGGAGEAELVALLTHGGRSACDPAHWYDDLPGVSVPAWHDTGWYRRALAHAEVARRRSDWREALDTLDRAAAENHDDARRIGEIQLRQAIVHLTRAESAADRPGRVAAAGRADRVAAAEAAVERAGQAVLTARDMRNQPAELRARCVLARALVLAGRSAAAERQGRQAETELYLVRTGDGPAATLLEAHVKVARARILLPGRPPALPRARRSCARPGGGPVPRPRAAGHGPAADAARLATTLLTEARATFVHCGDWRAAADCGMLMAVAAPLAGDPFSATSALGDALRDFETARDWASLRRAHDRWVAIARTIESRMDSHA